MIARTFFKPAKWKLGVLLLGSFLATSLAAAGQTNAPARLGQSQRFLIVVETSRAMARRAENSIKTVSNLIGSGLNGQMQTGDTLGLWTFNDTVSTGKFPLAKWWGENSKEIAEAAMGFLRQQKFEKGADFRQAMIGISKIAESSDRLTVIFVSTGESEISGTKYDDAINQSFKNWRAEQQKARMPVVTVLRASRGELVGNSVTPAPWQIEVPPWPQRVIAALTPKTNTAAPRLVPATTEVKSAPQSPAAITNTGALVFSGRKSNAPMTSASASGGSTITNSSTTKPADAGTPASDSPGSVQSPVFISAAAITNAFSGAAPVSPPPPTGTSNVRPAETTESAGALQVHARTPQDAPVPSPSPVAAAEDRRTQPAQSATALPPPSILSRKLVLAVGLGLTAVVGVFLFIRGGGNTRQESLITRSYQRQRK